MAILKFTFTREAIITHNGELTIEVSHARNIKEIEAKLRTRDFKTFRILGEEIEDDVWKFKPNEDESTDPFGKRYGKITNKSCA